MSISCDLISQGRLAAFPSPTLAVANKKLLIVPRRSIQRQVICIISGCEARQISNVFAQCEMSVYSQIRKWSVGVVLLCERFAGRCEVVQVFLGPPVGKATLSIELAACVVKTVADLMTDGRSKRIACSMSRKNAPNRPFESPSNQVRTAASLALILSW